MSFEIANLTRHSSLGTTAFFWLEIRRIELSGALPMTLSVLCLSLVIYPLPDISSGTVDNPGIIHGCPSKFLPLNTG